MPDVYTMVTSRIIEQLEKGIIPWRKPWRGNPVQTRRIKRSIFER